MPASMPQSPGRDRSLVTIAGVPSVTLDTAAAKWGLSPETLERWAWEGRLPDDLAMWSHAERRWLFGGRAAMGRKARDHAERGSLFLRGLHSHVADVTAGWTDDIDPDGVLRLRVCVVWWSVCADPTALEATADEFAFWCSNHPHGAGVAAACHEHISEWYRMLTAAGIEHSDPATRTRVTVLAEAPDDWEPVL